MKKSWWSHNVNTNIKMVPLSYTCGFKTKVPPWVKHEKQEHQVHICDTIKGNESHVGNIYFEFSTLITCPFKMLHFDLNPISIGHLVAKIWTFFEVKKTMKNIRVCHLFNPVTQNQYFRHLTHSPWSCHIYLKYALIKVHYG